MFLFERRKTWPHFVTALSWRTQVSSVSGWTLQHWINDNHKKVSGWVNEWVSKRVSERVSEYKPGNFPLKSMTHFTSSNKTRVRNTFRIEGENKTNPSAGWPCLSLHPRDPGVALGTNRRETDEAHDTGKLVPTTRELKAWFSRATQTQAKRKRKRPCVAVKTDSTQAQGSIFLYPCACAYAYVRFALVKTGRNTVATVLWDGSRIPSSSRQRMHVRLRRARFHATLESCAGAYAYLALTSTRATWGTRKILSPYF